MNEDVFLSDHDASPTSSDQMMQFKETTDIEQTDFNDETLQFGNITYEPFTICCAMPVIWSRQESFEISIHHWLHKCDHIFFFLERLNRSNTHIGDVEHAYYNSWNVEHAKIIKHKNVSFEWTFDPNIQHPTLYANDIDKYTSTSTVQYNHKHDIKQSPFQTNDNTLYWIVPLNNFIHKLFKSSVWISDSEEIVPLVGNLNLWTKISAMYIYLYLYHQDECNWIVKIDDDSILNIASIKSFLSYYNYRNNHYFGEASTRRIKMGQNIVYNGGSGYILSENAVKNLVLHSLNNMTYININPKDYSQIKTFESNLQCIRSPLTIEDVLMAVCLRNVGIVPEYIDDQYKRPRFPKRIALKHFLNISQLEYAVQWIETYRQWPVHNWILFHPIKIQLYNTRNEYESIVKYIVSLMNSSEPNWRNKTVRREKIYLNDKPCPFVCDWKDRANNDMYKIYIQQTLNCTFCKT